MTIYKQVPIEEELPPIGEEVWGLAANDLCTFERQKDNTYLLRGYDRTYRIEPQFWIKSITLPTEEEIRKHFNKETPHDCVFDIDYLMKGAEYILNILNQKK